MHSKDARAGGESEQRLYALNAWHETPFFTDRERAALAWTEAVTLVNQDHVPDAVYKEARERFSEEELVNLTMGRYDQRLESSGDCIPGGAGRVSAGPAESRRSVAVKLALKRRHNLAIQILRALYAIPRAFFVLEREKARVVCVQHDPHVALHIRIFPAIPILGVHIRVRVGREIRQRVKKQILMLPIAKIRRRFAERIVHFFDNDADIDRIRGQAPMIF